MTLIRAILSLICCLFISLSYAQIENTKLDLLKSFKHLNSLIVQSSDDTTGNSLDSLFCNDFDDKLTEYLRKYPFSIKPFDSLNNAGLGIATSGDGKIRFYTWDAGTGGMQHALNNLCQYKTAGGTRLLSNIGVQPYGDPAYIDTVYRFRAADKFFYAVLWRNAVGIRNYYSGIMIFGIQGDSLNTDIRIIETGSGIHSFLSCYYLSSRDDPDDLVTAIIFDPKNRVIKLPLINEDNRPTRKYITYKFTGKYFERVKS